ncbi:MAG: CoA pyrophosphatase [Halobacteriaceae archaeon]
MSNRQPPPLDLARLADRSVNRVDTTVDRAAVLVPVLDRRDPALLFTKRADHLGEHPGQMSFPGGGAEQRDSDLLRTALRECEEEIGLRSDEVQVAGRLDDILTVTDYAVSPFVGTVPDRTYHPDQREVAEVVALPLSGLTAPENHEVERREHPRIGSIDVHYFHVNGYTVWGATARILVQFLAVAAGWEPPTNADDGRK